MIQTCLCLLTVIIQSHLLAHWGGKKTTRFNISIYLAELMSHHIAQGLRYVTSVKPPPLSMSHWLQVQWGDTAAWDVREEDAQEKYLFSVSRLRQALFVTSTVINSKIYTIIWLWLFNPKLGLTMSKCIFFRNNYFSSFLLLDLMS